MTYSPMRPEDGIWMRQALALAEKGLFTTSPNPRVGAVIVREGIKVGQGFHQCAGQAHAEVLALAEARDLAQGATLYVTLEPCSHFGKTPPCADAVIRAGIKRVVIAMKDPNPLVAGKGIERLLSQGIEVSLGVEEVAAQELNIGFVSRMTRQRPWIRAKVAMSVDGVTALANGESQWITHETARADGHYFRARSCAVLTGAGTIRHDNPQLSVRLVDTQRQPWRLVIDNRLDTDPLARVYQGGKTVIFTVNPSVERARLYEENGVVVRRLASHKNGRVSLQALMEALNELEFNEVLLETGQKLTGVCLQERIIDEWICYVAPTFLGVGGAAMAEFGPLNHLSERLDMAFQSVKQLGQDLRIILRSSNSIQIK